MPCGRQGMGDKKLAALRWDAVADDLDFWAPAAAPRAEPSATPTQVRVWLFGSLGADDAPRPVVLRMAPGATVGKVLDELACTLGAERLCEIVGGRGEKLRTCRLFVDLQEVEDLSAPLAGRDGCSDLELIVLAGLEGG